MRSQKAMIDKILSREEFQTFVAHYGRQDVAIAVCPRYSKDLMDESERVWGILGAHDAAQRERIRELETILEANRIDAMIAHCWFSETFGEAYNGRDFSVKIPMARRELAALREEAKTSNGLVVEQLKQITARNSQNQLLQLELKMAREAIENAPHGGFCDVELASDCTLDCPGCVQDSASIPAGPRIPHVAAPEPVCNCWKSKALADPPCSKLGETKPDGTAVASCGHLVFLRPNGAIVAHRDGDGCRRYTSEMHIAADHYRSLETIPAAPCNTCGGSNWETLYDEESGVSGRIPCRSCQPVESWRQHVPECQPAKGKQ